MRVSPVKGYRSPVYPTRQEVDLHVELLRAVPRRWQQQTTLLLALSTALALTATQDALADNTTSQMVAPIFMHGDGQGAFGCVAVNPPVFLSEDEARAVIVEEAKRVGIQFVEDGKTLQNVYVPVVDQYGMQPAGRKRLTNLALDGNDAGKHVAFEYLSDTDLSKWETRFHQGFSTAYGYDIAGAAKELQQNLSATSLTDRLGIFYDPALGMRDLTDKYYAIRVKSVPIVPLRALCEWLGGTLKVDEHGTILLRYQQTTITLNLNSNAAMVGNHLQIMPAAVTEIKGVSYAPMSFLADIFHADKNLLTTKDYITITHPDNGDKLTLPFVDPTLLVAPGKAPQKRPQPATPELRGLNAESVKTLSREKLRRQVRDFITWLKAQGVV